MTRSTEVGFQIASGRPRTTTLVSGYLASGIPAALFAAAAALTACVAVRAWMMLDAADRGDVAALTRLSSPGWAVIAMIASWVIPGRMLQQVNGAIRGTRQ